MRCTRAAMSSGERLAAKGYTDTAMENPFKNIAIHLQATGPAAVIIVWIVAVTVLGLYGTGELARQALFLLTAAGGAILVALASRS
jgi:hypothetical protein